MNLSLKLLVEGPNVRKNFNEQHLAELTENIRLHGVLQDLLVRPRWCVGVSTRAEVERLNGRGDLQSSPFQIVAGARRFRAATAAELPNVPCKVRFFTDAEAFDIMLIENLQRVDLTPIEEAQGYHDALELRIEGKPVYTVETLSARINKHTEVIYKRLKLLDLPKDLREAVEQGILPVRQATLVARVPDREARAEAGEKVLHGHGPDSPLTEKETEELLLREYRRALAGAPFDQEDPALCALTAAGGEGYGKWSGKCSDCPFRSGNIPGFDGKRGDICTKPGCFVLKATAAFDRVATQAAADGKIVMRTGDAARHFDALGELTFTTTLARLAATPRQDQLKAEVRRAPTWEALAETARKAGLEVKVYVVRNPKTGIVEELLDTAPLIAAAKKIGEPIFRGGIEDEPLFTSKRPGEDDDDAFRRGQADLGKKREADAKTEAMTRQQDEAKAQLGFKTVFTALAKDCDAVPSWQLDAFKSAFLAAAGIPGLKFVAKLFALQVAAGEFGLVDSVGRWLDGLKPNERVAGSLMLLLCREIAAEGTGSPDFRSVANVLSIDLDKVTTEKPKPKKAKGKPSARAVAAVAKQMKAGKAPKSSKGKRAKKPVRQAQGRRGGAK